MTSLSKVHHRAVSKNTRTNTGKDFTKYLYNGEMYGKGRLVLAVVNDYVMDNPGITYDRLKDVFPDYLNGSLGVFSLRSEVEKRFALKPNKHHFLKPSEIIKLEDCEITVCVDWDVRKIQKFLKIARSHGIIIEVTAQRETNL